MAAKELQGARLKLDWADRHQRSLAEEIARYVKSHPHEFSVEQDGDVLTAGGPTIKVEPPVEIGLVFADCLNSLRAPLDYIAWELVAKYSGRTLADGEAKAIAFPVMDTPAKCQDRLAWLSKYSVPHAALGLIESVQPYHTGYEPLGVLNQLVNVDKHRLPLLTFAKIQTASIEVVVTGKPLVQATLRHPDSAATITGHNVREMSFRRLTPDDLDDQGRIKPDPNFGFTAEDIAELKRKAFEPLPSEPQTREVKVDGQVTVYVTFQDPAMPQDPIEQTLEAINKTVAGIIPRFEPFF